MPRNLKLLSSMAPREALAVAIDLYNKRGSTIIEAHATGGVDVVRRVAGGESIDIVVLADDAIDKLTSGGYLCVAGRIEVMTSRIAVAVRTGTAHPSVVSVSRVREAVANAATIGYSTGPSGRYLETLFSRWLLLEDLRPRIVVPPPGIAVAQMVASGQVELGFQQLSELKNVPGVDVVGCLPEAIQHLTTFSAALSTRCAEPSAALEFLAFLNLQRLRTDSRVTD